MKVEYVAMCQFWDLIITYGRNERIQAFFIVMLYSYGMKLVAGSCV